MTRSSSASALRMVIFSDVNGPVSATLAAETIRFARSDPRVEVVGMVIAQPAAFAGGPLRDALRFGRRLLVALANDDVPLWSVRSPKLDLSRLQRELDIPVLVPERGDLNDATFLRRLEREVRPQVALSYYCLSIFRRELLDRFEQCVNYHDSLLPAHRGLLATSYSVYEGDSSTGFTYHRMTEAIDRGPILVQGSVPIAQDEPLAVIRQRKLAAAAAALPDVLESVARGVRGREQAGEGGYHARRDVRALLHVERPEALASGELLRRIRAFGAVQITIDGIEYPVTRLRAARSGSRLCFVAADGVALEPDRLLGMPPRLFRLGQAIEHSRIGGALVAGTPVTRAEGGPGLAAPAIQEQASPVGDAGVGRRAA